MQVLIAYPFKTDPSDPPHLIYDAESFQDESNLGVAIHEHRPHVIIVGNNAVGSSTLELWRSIMSNKVQLTLIRRGSSLSRINIEQAKELNINVLNTLSVNSRFVVEYIIEHLHLSAGGPPATVAIIGSGAIDRRVADRLSRIQHEVYIYSPSLTNPDKNELDKIRRGKGIASSNISISKTPEEAVRNATHVILAIDADRVVIDEQKLSREFFQLIPNGARLVSVTEFRVFAEGALDILIGRARQGQLTARLDSHPYDIIIIEDPPIALEVASAAMQVPGCGEAMDQAALVVLSNLALKQTLKSPLSFSMSSLRKNEEITVVGAGIIGLITALFLSQSGYRVTVIDEHYRPRSTANESNRNETSSRDTTIDVCDAKHASVTETMPHAILHRIDSLKKCPSNRGWQVTSGFWNSQERAWIDRFSELAGYPELVAILLNEFVSNINRRGIELWEEIFRIFPQIVKNTVKSRRIIRIGPSLTALNNVSSFQRNYHENDDNLQRLSRAEVLARLPGLVLNDGNAGGIEVPGFTVNDQQLCANLINYLENNQNVTFKRTNPIRSLEDLPSSKIIFASNPDRFESSLLNTALSVVQGVLGCWRKVPNVHSITCGFKIWEKEPLGVLNVTPSNDEQDLYITGGFGYYGQRKVLQSKNINQLVDLFNLAVRSYLPEEFEASESENRITKFFDRRMTPDGLPIIAELNNDNSKQQLIYFIGGANSGDFVQAPVLATLLLDLIQGSTSNTSLRHVYRSLRIDRNTLRFN